MSLKFKTLTPVVAIQRLSDNDPTLTSCNLGKNAVMQMRGSELCPQIGAALAHNTHCQELILSDCNLSDQMVSEIASALVTNKVLLHLDLQENKIKDEGATALAKAIAQNQVLMHLNLLNQKGSRFGDATLHAFDDMFATNVTLLKIVWRLESRQSFRLTKMLTRNNDIDRRIKAARDYADLLPEKAQPIPSDIIAWRADAALSLSFGSSRVSQASRDLNECHLTLQCINSHVARYALRTGW